MQEENNTNDDRTINILVVEDNPVNVFLVKTIIQKLLPRVALIHAENGVEAITKFKDHALDLIFMDLNLPMINGLEAAYEIMQLENSDEHVPIIVLSGERKTDVRAMEMTDDIDDYISKPLRIDAMRKIISKYLNGAAKIIELS